MSGAEDGASITAVSLQQRLTPSPLRLGAQSGLVLDNARYQKCAVVKALAASLGIELLYLPSYSPNLNLIERLWKFVKKECLGCRVLPTYEAFTAAIDDCLANLDTCHKQQMATLLNLEFQLFDKDMPILAA